MLQLDISFLLHCFVFLPKALPVVPSHPPPDRHPNYFLTIFPPTNSCELNHFPSTGRGCFFVCNYLRALSLSLSLSLSLVFPCLSYLAVCVCRCRASVVAGHPLCWLQLVRKGCSFVFGSSFFFRQVAVWGF